MWTTRVFLSLTALCICVYQANGSCNPEVVKNIKEKHVDTSNILAKLKGEYIIFHYDAGNMNDVMHKECCKIRFFKEGDIHKLEYEKLVDGAFTLSIGDEDGTFKHTAKDPAEKGPPMTYYPFINEIDLFGVYVCNKETEAVNTDFTYLAVPVGKPTVGLTESLKRAVKLITSLGLPAGVESDGCFRAKDGEGNPGKKGECSMEPRTFYVVSCPAAGVSTEKVSASAEGTPVSAGGTTASTEGATP